MQQNKIFYITYHTNLSLGSGETCEANDKVMQQFDNTPLELIKFFDACCITRPGQVS